MLAYTGKIYLTRYANWNADPNPLLMVFHSDYLKTHALNLHYFPPILQIQFVTFLKAMKSKNIFRFYSGRLIYNILKKYYPQWVKTAYRTYHTNLLTGYMLNDGLTQPILSILKKETPEVLYKRDSFAVSINEVLKNKQAVMQSKIVTHTPLADSFAKPTGNK